ncbi:ubiquinone biosynthesis protein COQ4 [Kordiimonas laminariae]|uniref:ubiquinone biosynthesis protein COQ4 n=1 Tax=Kordiimonas laminariae TaxID=2917717 RepID=UPI001FF258A5|nr:ubiquinone biosynthesis protein COQ4 [Kordiimonas laminariae]MCK0069114.1 ubiquinone biosynthesis protein COQ4 [Kordiimonas laminariae]
MSSHTEEIKYTPQPRRWGDAWRALKQLMETPEDTTQVFKIMKALAGNSLFNEFKRFRKTDFGAKVLEERINLFDTLTNRDYLSKLPEGTLGKTYYDFCQREGISPEGLIEASAEEYEGFEDKNLEFYANRTRESHDLWHVVSGYGRDGLGEVCVVAFSYAQTKSLGFAAIAVMGAHKFKSDFQDANIWSTMWQAYMNGRKAAWLPGVNWEALMDKPLEEVREFLNIRTPQKYQKLDHVIAGTRPEVLATQA